MAVEAAFREQAVQLEQPLVVTALALAVQATTASKSKALQPSNPPIEAQAFLAVVAAFLEVDVVARCAEVGQRARNARTMEAMAGMERECVVEDLRLRNSGNTSSG